MSEWLLEYGPYIAIGGGVLLELAFRVIATEAPASPAARILRVFLRGSDALDRTKK